MKCKTCNKPIEQIDTGQYVHTGDYDADLEHVPTPSKKLCDRFDDNELKEMDVYDVAQHAMVLYLSDSAGIYIPKEWAESYTRGMWHGFNYVQDVVPLLDVDGEWYWEHWDTILSNAYAIDENGDKWYLQQDGDLWLVNYDLIEAWDAVTVRCFWEERF